MKSSDQAFAGPAFQEAIDYFRDKARVPTAQWTDIMGAAHARAFVVAGAMRDSLIEDFQGAILGALEDGTTLEDFRKEFDKIVARHGWSYNGSRGWRSAVIYDTNLRQAHMAGRWKQIWDNRANRPYLRYVALRSGDRRPEHQALHGLIRPVTDPIWQTIMPMNGWGCKCTVMSVSEDDLAARGWRVDDDSPQLEYVTRTVNARTGPFTVKVPKGFDPGFDYNPGHAAWGEKVSKQAIDAQTARGLRRWQPLGREDWQSLGRPQTVPVDRAQAALGRPTASVQEVRTVLEGLFGGEEKIYRLPDGGSVVMTAKSLAGHLDGPKLTRGIFLPLLPEILADPFEIWVSAEREVLSGKVAIRKRVIKVIDTGEQSKSAKGGRRFMVVLDVNKGFFTDWTFFPIKNDSSVNKKRSGFLVYARPEDEKQDPL